jgi:hypothetical protein
VPEEGQDTSIDWSRTGLVQKLRDIGVTDVTTLYAFDDLFQRHPLCAMAKATIIFQGLAANRIRDIEGYSRTTINDGRVASGLPMIGPSAYNRLSQEEQEYWRGFTSVADH